MRRLISEVRTNWRERVEQVGLTYHTHDSPICPRPYWHEAACYEFSSAEIDQIEAASAEMHALLIDVADDVVTRGAWDQLAIPEPAIPLIERSWKADDFSLYGRFDFAWMPGGAPKLLEYNADTPTSLVEAAVAQWHWQQDTRPECDQFNSLHERLIDAWKRYKGLYPDVAVIDFTGVRDNLEDEQTVSYLMDTAIQGGFQTRWSPIDELGYDKSRQCFVGAQRGATPAEPIISCFKLYPWEWLLNEQFGAYIVEAPTFWIEPAWKSLLSNKAILALAWAKHPGHANLLPCYFEPEKLGRSYVQKPKLSREGANIRMVNEGVVIAETSGDYGEDGYVYQAIAPVPNFEGNRPVFGAWIVDHEPAGLGVRESDGLVTDNLSRFVPHFFR
ncbi:MAG: glutathionylspermidine synthase family protein [Opitutus sp.]